MAQWAKRPPLKQEVPDSNPHGWFNGRAGNRDPLRWLETAWGLYTTHPIDRKGSVFPRRTGRSSSKGSISHPFAVLVKEDPGFLKVDE